MSQTSTQFDQAIASCSDIFIKKTKDYGTAWRVLRIISVFGFHGLQKFRAEC